MNHQLLGNERDAVVFVFWKDLPYSRRLALSFGLIVLGVLMQWYSQTVYAGLIPLLAGNALLLMRGYDNRLDLSGFKADKQWQKVERERLVQVRHLDRKMKKWDRSLIDISNPMGFVAFGVLLAVLVLAYITLDADPALRAWRVIPADAGILLLPHWFSGMRLLQRKPGLVAKTEALDHVLRHTRPEEQGDRVEVMMLLEGGEEKMPDDVKIRVMPKDSPEDFLGLYAQVVLNNVQGRDYPYLYVVLVARPELGLARLADHYDPPRGLLKEYKQQDGVDVLVIRQFTSKTSGYHTRPPRMVEIFQQGLAQMHKLAEPIS